MERKIKKGEEDEIKTVEGRDEKNTTKTLKEMKPKPYGEEEHTRDKETVEYKSVWQLIDEDSELQLGFTIGGSLKTPSSTWAKMKREEKLQLFHGGNISIKGKKRKDTICIVVADGVSVIFDPGGGILKIEEKEEEIWEFLEGEREEKVIWEFLEGEREEKVIGREALLLVKGHQSGPSRSSCSKPEQVHRTRRLWRQKPEIRSGRMMRKSEIGRQRQKKNQEEEEKIREKNVISVFSIPHFTPTQCSHICR